MDRRQFLKTVAVTGAGAATGGIAGVACAQTRGSEKKMAFLTDRAEENTLFPKPADGSTQSVSPPGLAWLPCPGASAYRVEIGGDKGSVYTKTIGSEPVHLPDRVLEAGRYTWDVVALDASGAEVARRGRQTFTIAADAIPMPWVEPQALLARVPSYHPRLLYPKPDLPAIRATLQTTRKNTWAACLRAAERALTMPAPTYPTYHKTEDRRTSQLEYGRYFADFRRYIDSALIDLSIAYLMTGDEKYATPAKRILLTVAEWPTDDDDVTSVLAKWGDEPGLSLARCAHRAYDWLHPSLSEAERAKVLRMCEARAAQTLRRLKRSEYLVHPGESHNGRLIAYLTDMALVMAGESPQAKDWLDYSLKALTTIYPHWGGDDGGWAEGPPYGLWYNGFYVPALEGLRQLTGLDLWQRPFFRNVRRFFFYCTAIRGEMRPFGDSAIEGGPGIKGGGGYAELMHLHAHRFNDPAAGWWAKQVKPNTAGSGDISLLYPDEPPSAPPANLPNAAAFTAAGWAGLHSDISRPDDDTCLVFKSSPYGSVSHSHADQNAFAIMKGGVALAIPSGYYGPSYGMPHHALWTRSTKANNAVLVNGEGQAMRDAKAQGRLIGFEERKGLAYVAGDATAAYRGKLLRCERHILFLRPGVFLVLDDLKAPQASTFQWMLHALEQMTLADSQVISTRKGARLDVRLHAPVGLRLSQTDQFDTPFNEGIPPQFHKEMANHWHVTAETQKAASETRIAAVMAVNGTTEKLTLEPLQHPGWFGARATGEFGTVEGWIQIEPTARGPEGFGALVSGGRARLCGKAADGSVFAV